MTVVLRDLQSGRFYAGERRWVEELNRARQFQTSYEAFEHARSKRLRGVEVLHASRVPGMNFSVPVEVLPGGIGDIPGQYLRRPQL